MSDQQVCYGPDPFPSISVDRGRFHATVHAYQAATRWAKELQSLGVDGMPLGPFRDCPVCAQLPGQEWDGECRARCWVLAECMYQSFAFALMTATSTPTSLQPALNPPHPTSTHAGYLRSMSLDVVNKLGRYAFQGGASNHLSPWLSHYYGEASAEYERRSSCGAATLADVMAGPAPDDDEHGGCHASFKAARMDCKHKGPRECDIQGALGGTCSHGVPVAGTFVDLDTPENFTYYLLCMLSTITAALDAGENIGDIYIDFGCKLKKTWARFIETLEEREEITSELARELSQVRVLVDWLHANAHDLKCQLENSGRYTTGAATVVGEMTEQLWAMTKVLTPS